MVPQPALPQVYMLSVMPLHLGYPFGHLGSAVLAVPSQPPALSGQPENLKNP